MLAVGWAGLRWHSFLWFVALLMDAWYMLHTLNSNAYLIRCGSTDGQYKSYGGMMNGGWYCFAFWTMLCSSRFTESGKKVGTLSTLYVTMSWPLYFAGTGLVEIGTEVDSEANFSNLHGVQDWWSLQRTSCKHYWLANMCSPPLLWYC